MEDINALKEELKMWKSRAEEYRSDLEEYQQQSLEYESEMEQEINDLKQRNNDYAYELSELKEKFRELHVKSNETCLNYQNELDRLKKINEQKRTRERELEIVNDELERKIRITGSTCQDLKVKYNQLLERNVYLQQEVENKMELTVTIQRLKDELKDSNIELAVLRSKLNNTNNTIIETITPLQTPSPKKSLTPVSSCSTIYNYDYNQDNENNMNTSPMSTPTMTPSTMNDDFDVQSQIYSSDDMIKENNISNIGHGLMIFRSNTTAISKKSLLMLQEFLERAKSLEMKIASARSTLVHANELSS
jgi:FtsZ-binding cell division protein ZapB